MDPISSSSSSTSSSSLPTGGGTPEGQSAAPAPTSAPAQDGYVPAPAGGGTYFAYNQQGQLVDSNGIPLNLLEGTQGDDTLQGTAAADEIQGLGGDDSLYGGAGDDVIAGGPGNDFLQGDAGNDTYLWGPGSGQETINNYDTTAGRVDTVVVTGDVTPGQVAVAQSGNDLMLAILGSTDTLRVTNALQSGGATPYAINFVSFADGTKWDLAVLKAKLVGGNDGNESISGASAAIRRWMSA